MYHEISLQPEDKDIHHFIFRAKENMDLCEYRMTRLTFGIASSLCLATMTLQQVAKGHLFPDAAKLLLSSFYVNDYLSGSSSTKEAIKLRSQMQQLVHKGRFTIHKWRFNASSFMETVPPNLQEAELIQYSPNFTDVPKTLGIHWDSLADVFRLPILLHSQILQPGPRR